MYVPGQGAPPKLSLEMQVIAELDEKKQEALQKTWTEVNQKFGSIFSTLLPSTSAKLEPQEGRSFLDGALICPSCQLACPAPSI